MNPAKLTIIHYPDPRLRTAAQPIEAFDDALAAVAARMFELMRAAKGVGLAAPQVGLSLRLFVANPTDDPANDCVYINPVLEQLSGGAEGEEGCLSLPAIRVTVRRAATCSVRAVDLHGRPFAASASDLLARIWQHETDHLDGRLIIDRAGPTDRIAIRKTLQALEQAYEERHPRRKRPAAAGRARRQC